jgi:hypothetical protein
MTRMFAAPLAALLAALTLPAAASALVQVDQGIGGARLGNTRAEVRSALGPPRRVIKGTNDFGPFVSLRYHGRLTVNFQGRRKVSSVSTTGLGDRTAAGVGIGSTEKAVKRGVPGVRCGKIAGTRSCHTGRFRAGRIVTDFVIKNGRVARITVGKVLD